MRKKKLINQNLAPQEEKRLLAQMEESKELHAQAEVYVDVRRIKELLLHGDNQTLEWTIKSVGGIYAHRKAILEGIGEELAVVSLSCSKQRLREKFQRLLRSYVREGAASEAFPKMAEMVASTKLSIGSWDFILDLCEENALLVESMSVGEIFLSLIYGKNFDASRKEEILALIERWSSRGLDISNMEQVMCKLSKDDNEAISKRAELFLKGARLLNFNREQRYIPRSLKVPKEKQRRIIKLNIQRN